MDTLMSDKFKRIINNPESAKKLDMAIRKLNANASNSATQIDVDGKKITVKIVSPSKD